MKITRIFALILALATPLTAKSGESIIRKACPLARKVSIVSSPSALQSAICDLRDKYPASPEVKSLTGDVLKTVSELKGSAAGTGGKWAFDQTLNSALEKLSSGLNEVDPKSRGGSNSPLGLAVKNLLSKWNDPAARANPANRDAYIHDLNNVLERTKTGKDVLSCYASAKGPRISGEQIIDIPEKERAKGKALAFGLIENPEKPGTYIKTIFFNAEESPMLTLILYVHELKHGCNSNVVATHDEKLKNPKEDFTKIFQNRALDEIRAYRVSVEFFKELAQEVPDLACNNYSTSTIFGTQVLSSAEYNAKLDEMYQDGSFPKYLISKYSDMGSIPAKYVFKSGKNGKSTKTLRDDLVESLQAEGFIVSP